MTSLARAIAQGGSGVYRLDPEKGGELPALTRAAGLALHRVDLSHAPGKPAILAAFSRELRFPDWFGENWDALQDALCDLSWLPQTQGIVLVVEGPEADRAAALDELLDVLRSAARYWHGEKRQFLALVASAIHPELPTLR